MTDSEHARYARHLLLPEVGREGQERLIASSVLLVGAGGLGSPAALYLAAAGIGRLGIVDFDTVERSNLQRQVLHGESDIGRLKVESARDRLREINPLVAVETYPERFGAANAAAILGDYDLVVNGADNFATRYLLSDACVRAGKVHVHGAIHRFAGEVTVFGPGGPCYRCLHPSPPPAGSVPSCADAGVLGVLPGIVGSLQAAETLKILLGIGESLRGRLLLIDVRTMRFREIRLPRNPRCAACGGPPSAVPLTELEAPCLPESPIPMNEITPVALKARLDRGDDFQLIDVREPFEIQIARIPGAIVIPLGTLPAAVPTLDPDADIVVMCRSGKRSADAVAFLASQGFTTLANLSGGILAWADTVDPTMTKY